MELLIFCQYAVNFWFRDSFLRLFVLFRNVFHLTDYGKPTVGPLLLKDLVMDRRLELQGGVSLLKNFREGEKQDHHNMDEPRHYHTIESAKLDLIIARVLPHPRVF